MYNQQSAVANCGLVGVVRVRGGGGGGIVGHCGAEMLYLRIAGKEPRQV